MKRYAFAILITTLTLLAIYLFYASWHTETKTISEDTKTIEDNVTNSLADKKLIPKKPTIDYKPKEHQKNLNSIANKKYDTDKQIQTMEEQVGNIPNMEHITEQTKDIYESLTPPSYDETMEEARIAFEQIDEDTALLDDKLTEEMTQVEESMEDTATDETTESIEAEATQEQEDEINGDVAQEPEEIQEDAVEETTVEEPDTDSLPDAQQENESENIDEPNKESSTDESSEHIIEEAEI